MKSVITIHDPSRSRFSHGQFSKSCCWLESLFRAHLHLTGKQSLLLISINFTPKTSHSCLKKPWYEFLCFPGASNPPKIITSHLRQGSPVPPLATVAPVVLATVPPVVLATAPPVVLATAPPVVLATVAPVVDAAAAVVEKAGEEALKSAGRKQLEDKYPP